MSEGNEPSYDAPLEGRASAHGLGGRPGSDRLPRLFVGLVLAAVRAEFLQLEPVGIVAAILLRDVVAVLAHLAGQSDLRPYVGTGRHVRCLFLECLKSSLFRLVAMAGLEPAT